MRHPSKMPSILKHETKGGQLSSTSIALMLGAAIMTLGCNRKPDGIEVLSFRNAEQQETFVENFPPGHFRINSEKTYEIILELEPKLLEVPAAAAEPTDHSELSGNESSQSDTSNLSETDSPIETPASQPVPPDLVWTSQLLKIELLWKPIPGKTYAESSQTNATIIYCLVNGDNAISYEGAGFVFFKLSRDGKELEGRIESASLRPTRFQRDPVDLFGPCRISGDFTATEGAREVATVRQRLRRLLGKPSTGIEGPN
jgi:hypothetical protein